MSWLPVLFVIIPFTELMILLKVGALWGVWPTLGLIILTAGIGFQLFRYQGLKLLSEIQVKMNQGQMPSNELLEGAMVLVAGVLMITPGLLTDVVGLICLIPITRKILLKWAQKHVVARVQTHAHIYQQTGYSHTYEGEYSEENKPSAQPKSSSSSQIEHNNPSQNS